jgi:hypothetical protein
MLKMSTTNCPAAKSLLIANILAGLTSFGLRLCLNPLAILFLGFPSVAGLLKVMGAAKDDPIEYASFILV